ncbi:hypothetical protein LXL04_024370 [Taraxacum kok-saghyz]
MPFRRAPSAKSSFLCEMDAISEMSHFLGYLVEGYDKDDKLAKNTTKVVYKEVFENFCCSYSCLWVGFGHEVFTYSRLVGQLVSMMGSVFLMDGDKQTTTSSADKMHQEFSSVVVLGSFENSYFPENPRTPQNVRDPPKRWKSIGGRKGEEVNRRKKRGGRKEVFP